MRRRYVGMFHARVRLPVPLCQVGRAASVPNYLAVRCAESRTLVPRQWRQAISCLPTVAVPVPVHLTPAKMYEMLRWHRLAFWRIRIRQAIAIWNVHKCVCKLHARSNVPKTAGRNCMWLLLPLLAPGPRSEPRGLWFVLGRGLWFHTPLRTTADPQTPLGGL